MDESVVRAMQTWPNVPDVYGWLRLDGRGQWHLRNGRVTNPALIRFIARNYLRLDNGGYAFQNGPQRVHVEIEVTPWILHLRPGEVPALEDHIGGVWRDVSTVWLTAEGEVLCERRVESFSEVGRLRDTDLGVLMPMFRVRGEAADDETLTEALAEPDEANLTVLVEGCLVPCRRLEAESLPARFGFIAKPLAPA